MISLSKRIYSSEALASKIGATVVLAGWAEQIKVMGKLAFIKLRDRNGYAQLTFLESNFPNLNKLSRLTKESVISVKGKVVKSKSRQFPKEILVSQLDIINRAETPLPIEFLGKGIETGLAKRLDHRFIDLRNPTALAIFKIRSAAVEAIRECLSDQGFIEMHTPKISGAGAEGGATMFPVVYFGKKAYLSQSQQLYKQMMMATGFDRVFEIGPSFRAEKSHTLRHLTEFTQLDLEMAFITSEEDVLKLQERLLVYVIKYLQKNCRAELELLGKKPEVPKIPFPRITHVKATELLQKAGVKIKQGTEIDLEHEKNLGQIIKKKYGADAYFLTKFPWHLSVCKFYWMQDGETGRGADLEYKGQELVTGAQREHRYDVLVQQIKDKKLNPKDFISYLYPFKFGMPPHGGFGWGIDRMLSYILDVENIREVVLFPRDPERLNP